MCSASWAIAPESFDSPAVRSRNTIGTSTTRAPRRVARWSISSWNAKPCAPTVSSSHSSEQVGAEGAEPRRGIVRRQVQEPPTGVLAAGAGQQPTVERPAGRRATRDVAGADREVGAGIERGDQRGNGRGVVGEVGVHLDDRVVAVRETVAEPVAVRGAEAGLTVAPHHRDRRRAPARATSAKSAVPSGLASSTTSTSTAGAAVRMPGEQPLDVVGLVERGDDHQHVW